MKKLLGLAVFLVFNALPAQQAGIPAPQTASVENDPMANYHQRWTPMMQKLFQQVRDDDGIVRHYVGAEVGSPYEVREFLKGSVYYEDENLGEYYYRYNIFSGEIELKRTQLDEEKRQALIRDPKVTLVPKTGPLKYVFHPFFNLRGERKEDYLILLYKGEHFRLYKHLESKFTEAKPAANSMVSATPSRFSTFTSYFIQEEDGAVNEIPLKKNKFLKEIDASMADEIKTLLKEERIDLSKEPDLIRAISQMDLLAKS